MEFNRMIKEINSALPKNKQAIPFSNGTQAMEWTGRNCERCVKAITTRIPDYVYEENPEDVILCGRDCIGNYSIGFSFIIGHIPLSIAEWIKAEISHQKNGIFAYLPNECPYFSDDERDNPDNQIDPDPYDPNQLIIPFGIEDLFGIDVFVTDTAIIERGVLQNT